MNSFVKTSFGDISYSLKGQGKPVVLLHGYLESKEIWKDFLPFFTDTFKVLCIDLPGHGDSIVFNDNTSIDQMANALEEVLTHLNIEKACIVGHSMGGYVSLAFADFFPERVSKIVLLNSHPNADSLEKVALRLDDIKRIQDGYFKDIVNLSIPRLFASDNLCKLTDEVSYSLKIALETSTQGAITALKAMAGRQDRNYVLKKISAPICLIFGRKDNLINDAMANEIVSHHPKCRVFWLEESGHMSFIEEKDQTARAITSFLTT